MKLLISCMLVLSGCGASGQGTFLYTWHGSQNLFQASFQVPADENQPGQYFEDGIALALRHRWSSRTPPRARHDK
jgi:hypothetical protein